MKLRILSGLAIVLTAVVLSSGRASAQGCVVARSSATPISPENGGGAYDPHELDVSIGYRHLFSFRHYVGNVEQTQRIAQGTQVMNKINLEDADITYQLTPRVSVNCEVPVFSASRRGNNQPYTYTAAGFGDVSFGVQSWILNPRKSHRGNVALGLGLQIPTGQSDVSNNIDKLNGKGPQPTFVDYSIQPGSGGYGVLFRWQAYLMAGRENEVYFNGSYLATPQNVNNTLRTGSNPTSLTAYNSISDEYLMEAGIARSIHKIHGLAVSVGPRFEGVPANDLIGDSLGFRRPGYSLSIMPGVEYARGPALLTFGVGKALYRDRTVSVPDQISGGHGDAAFADYIWLGSISYRFGGPKSSEGH